ncbi:hypothetical protein TeGR_g6417 [Tetraparma gracilis]|uniref:MCM C-terminal AAA(+) ATPase domain-containing protein n=1 Tax=Tetraparma gracilis TaxID=2962635 RepID=A0ABQ6MYI5_9STRA|nr:hypothetical protein TeGR_g6417 [Tetraparma gracilis]
MVLSANCINVNNSSATMDLNINQTDDLTASFVDFWKSAVAGGHPVASRNLIVKSFCPKLYGMMAVKLGLLLTLIGGVGDEENPPPPDPNNPHPSSASASSASSHSTSASQTTVPPPGSSEPPPSSAKRRAQCHCLMVGDPGTGKSQLLRFAKALSPRSVMTTGVGTTSAGLTCSAVKDGNSWSLEAGALVLADRGVCCIDEFGCITKKDLTSIHEAMEQQCLSVAKAGLVCKLNSRATVIATTNPKGSYDQTTSLRHNTGIDDPLLSRFDLIFLMLDSHSMERDGNIVDHILNAAIKGADKEEERMAEEASQHTSTLPDMDTPWSLQMLRSYIAIVKDRFRPVLSQAAVTILSGHYSYCRRLNQTGNPTTVRLLESLIRLSQAHARLMWRSVVTDEDACAAVMVMETTFNVAGGMFFPQQTNDLWQEPMESEFPPPEAADWTFNDVGGSTFFHSSQQYQQQYTTQNTQQSQPAQDSEAVAAFRRSTQGYTPASPPLPFSPSSSRRGHTNNANPSLATRDTPKLAGFPIASPPLGTAGGGALDIGELGEGGPPRGDKLAKKSKRKKDKKEKKAKKAKGGE